jgi:hypothetical protein
MQHKRLSSDGNRPLPIIVPGFHVRHQDPRLAFVGFALVKDLQQLLVLNNDYRGRRCRATIPSLQHGGE